MPEPENRPGHTPSRHDPDFCRVCCTPIAEDTPCIPHPGNPDRPFFTKQAMESLIRQDRFRSASPAISSAPPDDDPEPLHVLAYINELTLAKERGAGSAGGWRLKLARGIANRLSPERRRRIRRQWELESCQTLYEDGLAVETPFSRYFMVGRYIVEASLSQDGRTVTVVNANGRPIRLRPSRRAAEFAQAVNRYAAAAPP